MLKRPEDITLPDGRTLRQALDDHSKWLIDKTTGKRLDLTGADMSRADLTGANMTSATMIRVNLCETKMIHADMSYAHMTGADMSYSDIVGARLYRANLTGANLTGADMSYSDIIGATMYGVDLTDANMTGADMSGADLRCYGNMREIRTMQIDTWPIGYTHDTLQIGCQRHPIEKWRKWSTDAGRKWVDQMHGAALERAERNLALVLQIIDANPATK